MSQGRRSPLSRLRVYTLQQDMVRPKRVKYRKTPKMDLYRKRVPDYSELAYREAVAKLKYLLAESYTPVSAIRKTQPMGVSVSAEKDWSDPSMYPLEAPRFRLPSSHSDEVTPYQRRQEEYIDHLEKEGHLYREELSRILDKVKEVVGKNREESEEDDSEKEPKGRSRNGPNIVYSSRISELEAQLTQCRLELRKAQDEASYLKAHSKPIQPPVTQQALAQMEVLQRERDELNERVSSLQDIVSQLRDKEASASQKAKRSLDVVEQAQFDKNQLEMEVRRLRSELERMSEKQREALQESARRVSEAERRYAMQMERLNGDLAAQWDAANRLNLELDRARRTETELRRELAQKVANVEELKKELTTKTGSLQTEALTAGAERESLEAELTASRLATERAERQGRQEVSRLQAEVQALRARLDRADQDLLYSRKENIRLADVIAGLEKELNLAKLTKDSSASKESKRADELTSMIKELDTKHAESVSELEGLIQSQTELMEKLNAECQGLTRKLEESSARHKEEMAKLQNNVEYLSSKLEAPHNQWRDDEKLGIYKEDEINSGQEEINRKAKEIINTTKEIAKSDFGETGAVREEQTGNGKEHYAKQEATNKSDIKPELKNKSYNENTNKSYPQEVYTENKNETYQQQEPYNENDINKYDGNQEYNKNAAGGHNQGEVYDQSGTKGYNQEQEYDQAAIDNYDQGRTYEQGEIDEYQEEQVYTGAEGYQLDDQAYDPTGPKEYTQNQMYEANNEGYEQGQTYDQQGQPYDQHGNEGYDQNHLYDQSTAGYAQDQGYAQGQIYDETGAEQYDGQVYGQLQGEEYDQNQGYVGSEGNYPQEQSYDPNTTDQAYIEGNNYETEGYVYEEKK